MSFFCLGVNGDGDEVTGSFKFPKFVVMGHRGSGMNMLQSSDKRMKSIKENTILAFNAATNLPLDFIEFDVQVGFFVFQSFLLIFRFVFR